MTAPRKVPLIEETPGTQSELELALQDESAGLNDRPSPAGPTRQMYRMDEPHVDTEP